MAHLDLDQALALYLRPLADRPCAVSLSDACSRLRTGAASCGITGPALERLIVGRALTAGLAVEFDCRYEAGHEMPP